MPPHDPLQPGGSRLADRSRGREEALRSSIQPARAPTPFPRSIARAMEKQSICNGPHPPPRGRSCAAARRDSTIAMQPVRSRCARCPSSAVAPLRNPAQTKTRAAFRLIDLGLARDRHKKSARRVTPACARNSPYSISPVAELEGLSKNNRHRVRPAAAANQDKQSDRERAQKLKSPF